APHFLGLGVAGAEIVEDRVADDVTARRLPADVLTAPAYVAADLQFEVQRLAVAWPLELIVGPDHRKAVALVVDGLAPENLDVPLIGAGIHLPQSGLGIRRAHSAKLTCCG